MILESVENGPLIWPTIKENRVTKTKKYAELSAAEKIQADCDMKATNIILQGLLADIYSLLHAYLEQHELHANEVRLLRERNQDPLAFVANQQITPPHFNTYQSSYNNPHIQQQFPPSQYGSIHPSFVVPVFSPGYDLIACLNKAMDFLTTVASSRFPSTNNQLRTSSNLRNQAHQFRWVVKCYNCQGEGHMSRQCTQPKRPRNTAWYKDKAMLAKAQEAGQILDEEQLAFLADPGVPDGQAQKRYSWQHIQLWFADVISENFEQTPAVDFTDNEIHSDSDIISYS
ncbi:integrase, catalytic region, zinc finger, CCHC-type containing protein [Tanacetum coccineum]